jgi:hypothetical protein
MDVAAADAAGFYLDQYFVVLDFRFGQVGVFKLVVCSE